MARADITMHVAVPAPKIAHSSALVARHRAVEVIGLALFVAEILDRLVIQQRVDRLRMGVSVGVVHLAADADPPVARPDRKPDIVPHRHGDDDQSTAAAATRG